MNKIKQIVRIKKNFKFSDNITRYTLNIQKTINIYRNKKNVYHRINTEKQQSTDESNNSISDSTISCSVLAKSIEGQEIKDFLRKKKQISNIHYKMRDVHQI